MMTWALENGIETADSMKSRGYDLKGRTSFSNYRFDNRYKMIMEIMIYNKIIILIGNYRGENNMIYFPAIKMVPITIFSIIDYLAYFLLCITPVILDIKEEIKWRHLELNN